MSRGRKPLPNPYGFSRSVIGRLRMMEREGRRPTKLAMKCLVNDMARLVPRVRPVNRITRQSVKSVRPVPIEIQRLPPQRIQVTYEDAMARKSL